MDWLHFLHTLQLSRAVLRFLLPLAAHLVNDDHERRFLPGVVRRSDVEKPRQPSAVLTASSLQSGAAGLPPCELTPKLAELSGLTGGYAQTSYRLASRAIRSLSSSTTAARSPIVQARREAEARRRRQEEERKQEEAANNVREVLKKLRNATPDNLKSLQADLDKAAASNFQAMGALRDRVNDEMQHTITQVQKRIAEELKQREEAERRRQMELARVEQLLKEAAAEVQSTEARVTQAQEATTLACQRGIDAEAAPEDILQAVQEAGKILEDAKGLLDRSERLLSVKKEAMGAGEGARHVKREVDDLTDRLQQSHRSLQRCTETLEETRGKSIFFLQ
ncbi:hypothetical protein AK812_SmicGene26029 [Symbiodinium microadriaticum]|uniref:Uncharacterized protein n=1 Tax=Symbiodinium microadriaticum TaxID=2951 RepID=A0A1Q9DAP7_SYMMI|nr:hypothetical protein AK812_SmicGene26029 [Symbiodinium microadriaticum]